MIAYSEYDVQWSTLVLVPYGDTELFTYYSTTLLRLMVQVHTTVYVVQVFADAQHIRRIYSAP
jgi:hypothetical protein